MHSCCLQKMRHNDSLPNSISCCSGICACAKGGQWHHALGLFVGMRHNYLLPNVIIYNSGNNACDKDGQWHHAPGILVRMRLHNLLLDISSYNSTISACEKRWAMAPSTSTACRDATQLFVGRCQQLQFCHHRL